MPEWTIDTLREHVLALIEAAEKQQDQRFAASEKALELGFQATKSAVDAAFAATKSAVEAALAAQSAAVIKAELAADKRFESVNEFRATLADQQRTLMPRSEVEAIVRALNTSIEAVKKQDEMNLKALQERVDEQKAVVSAMRSESTGIKGGWGYAVGVVGFVLVLTSLVLMAFGRG